jgi:glycosyltransferase involved in cell wall biosynthesis
MPSAQTTKPKILMVMNGPPWSSWTMSGVSAGVCQELLRRDFLYGAVSNRCLSARTLRSPGYLHHFYEKFGNFLSRFSSQAAAPWVSEGSQGLSELLSAAPPELPVIYTYVNPTYEEKYSLRRFRWIGISVLDAAHNQSYGYEGISEDNLKQMYKQQFDTVHQTEAIFTHSSYGADSIARDFDYPRQKIYPIGAGASLQFDQKNLIKVERYSRENILFVGRNWVRKGGPLLYQAFLLLKARMPHATLTIVGPDEAPVSGDGIIYEGFLRKHKYFECRRLKKLFEKASLFCTPSVCETWGLVYVEAAASGLPIVGTNEWAMPDIVINGKTGILCQERSPQALAEAMVNILSSPSTALDMGLAATNHVRDVLDWPNVVDRMMAAIRPEALGGREPTWLPGDHHRLNRQQEVNTE